MFVHRYKCNRQNLSIRLKIQFQTKLQEQMKQVKESGNMQGVIPTDTKLGCSLETDPHTGLKLVLATNNYTVIRAAV